MDILLTDQLLTDQIISWNIGQYILRLNEKHLLTLYKGYCWNEEKTFLEADSLPLKAKLHLYLGIDFYYFP